MPEPVVSDLDALRGLLARFEQGLDLRRPERSVIPARVLGYGEITTVFEIPGAPEAADLAFKRMPMFRSAAEAESYETLHRDYERVLRYEVGVDVVESTLIWLGREKGTPAPSPGRPIVLYLVQPRFPGSSFLHVALRGASPETAREAIGRVLGEIGRLVAYRARGGGAVALGLDAQVSNWVAAPGEGGGLGRLRYVDTSTPLVRHAGTEQLDPELFLRSAPAPLAWVIRRFMLADVLDRYYDPRRIAVDVAANLFKEQRPDLVPDAVQVVNEALSGWASSGVRGAVAETDRTRVAPPPLTLDEVRGYYREDVRVWKLYLASRKIDRALHAATGRRYPYLLPHAIER